MRDGTFTSRFNRRHEFFGHLFSGRYKKQGVGEHRSWDGKRETEEQKAERIVAEELRKRRWAAGTRKERRKTDAEKAKLAQRLRQETVMTLDWIAERLEMCCRHTLANCLRAGRVTNNRDPFSVVVLASSNHYLDPFPSEQQGRGGKLRVVEQRLGLLTQAGQRQSPLHPTTPFRTARPHWEENPLIPGVRQVRLWA